MLFLWFKVDLISLIAHLRFLSIFTFINSHFIDSHFYQFVLYQFWQLYQFYQFLHFINYIKNYSDQNFNQLNEFFLLNFKTM